MLVSSQQDWPSWRLPPWRWIFGNDKTRAHAVKPKANRQQRGRSRTCAKKGKDGIQRIKQSKGQDATNKYTQTHTVSRYHWKGHNCHESTSKPNQRQEGRAAQDKDHWQTACVCRPPLLLPKRKPNPVEENPQTSLTCVPALMPSGTVGVGHLQGCWMDGWSMVNGQTRGGGRLSRVEWVTWRMGFSRGRIWACRERGQRKEGESWARDRRGGGRGGEEKGRCCFLVSLPCLWRTYVSWCWRPGWYWWT